MHALAIAGLVLRMRQPLLHACRGGRAASISLRLCNRRNGGWCTRLALAVVHMHINNLLHTASDWIAHANTNTNTNAHAHKELINYKVNMKEHAGLKQ